MKLRLRWPLDLRADERPRVVFFAQLAAGIGFAQTLGLAAAEANFLASVGIARLPEGFVWAALASALATLAYAAIVGRARNDRLLVALIAIATVIVGWFGWISAAGSSVAPWGLLCAYFAIQSVVLSHFVNFQADYFDVLASKRVFPVLAAAASAGGAAGGLAAAAIARGSAPALVTAWAASLAALGGVLAVSRSRLGLWYPILEEDESDDASVEGMRAALRYTRDTPMARWLVLSVLSMVAASFLLQYAYSARFVARFPSAGELGLFLGAYLMISNLMEVAFGLWISPRLVGRLGVPDANLGHPVLMLSSLGLMAGLPGIGIAVAARFSREALENVLAQPVRQLTYNALPSRVRGRLRALLDGFVLHVGMALTGLGLLLVHDVNEESAISLGLIASLLYLFANTRVRRHYVRTLVDQLLAGRTGLLTDREAIDRPRLRQIVDQWDGLMESQGGRRVAIELAPRLAAEGWITPLICALDQPDGDLRAACAAALFTSEAPDAVTALREVIQDEDPRVRRIAVEAWHGVMPVAQFERLRRDSDPGVRACAAVAAGETGWPTLAQMLEAGGADAAAALRCLPHEHVSEATSRLGAEDEDIRVASLRRLLVEPDVDPELSVAVSLGHRSASVRLAAAEFLTAHPAREAADQLKGCLRDGSVEVREAASAALAALGDEGLEQAQESLRGGSFSAGEAGLAAIALAADPGRRERLGVALQGLVRRGIDSLAALDSLASAGEAGYLSFAHADRLVRSARLAFVALRLREGAQAVHLERALRWGGARTRALALEALGQLARRDAVPHLTILLEPGAMDERLTAAGASRRGVGVRELAAEAAAGADPWMSLAGRATLAAPGAEERVRMDRLVALRSISLFQSLSLEQLDAIGDALLIEEWPAGEVVVRQGEAGDHLFLVLEGRIGIFEDRGEVTELQINEVGEGGYFGEMAVLREERRTATAVVVGDATATLGQLSGEHLRALILRTPEISFGIMSDLIARAENADARRRQGRGGDGA